MSKETHLHTHFLNSTLCIVWLSAVCTATAGASTFYNCNTKNGCLRQTSKAQTNNHSKTKYPIILAHGGGGFSQVSGINYFYQIPESLAVQGSDVFQTTVPAFNTAEIRGEYLYQQVSYAKAITDAGKVNLIGHSMGGFDVRYVAGEWSEEVASVTTLGTPHKSTPLADKTDKLGTTVFGKKVITGISRIAQWMGIAISKAQGIDLPQDGTALLRQVNKAGTSAFTKKYPYGISAGCSLTNLEQPEKNGIYYYSWGGSKAFTNALDPTDYVFLTTSLLIDSKNDGVVTPCSTHLGYVVNDSYQLNHFDLPNQVLGLRSWRAPNVIAIYRNHASRLKNIGL